MTFDVPAHGAVGSEWPLGTDHFSTELLTATIGDRDIATTYAAIGEASARWQRLELAFAHLYARFRGYPAWLDKVRHFGACLPDFDARIKALEGAAAGFFAIHPDADGEAAFRDLCRAAIGAFARQARIAGGIVQNVAPEGSAPRFALDLPWHMHDRARLSGAAAIGSAEIRDISEAFLGLALRVKALDRRCAQFAL